MNQRRHHLYAILIALSSVLVLLLAPFCGREWISPLGWLNGSLEVGEGIILEQLRFPRVFVAFLAGSALAAGGVSFQALFRNPLAEPFTLGVSSGASLGSAIAIHCGWTFSLAGYSAVTWSAFLAAAGTILIVYLLARKVNLGDTSAAMLLAGVAISFFYSSLILFLQYLSDFTRTFRMLRWVMGGMENIVTPQELQSLALIVLVGCLTILLMAHELNLLVLGDDFAQTRGVSLGRVRFILYFAVSLMIGAVVAYCGPIAFVGLIVPHICRLLVGADHRRLLPISYLAGGSFLVLCDLLGRSLWAQAELPVGILTALLGGPFFLWLLLHRKSHIV